MTKCKTMGGHAVVIFETFEGVHYGRIMLSEWIATSWDVQTGRNKTVSHTDYDIAPKRELIRGVYETVSGKRCEVLWVDKGRADVFYEGQMVPANIPSDGDRGGENSIDLDSYKGPIGPVAFEPGTSSQYFTIHGFPKIGERVIVTRQSGKTTYARLQLKPDAKFREKENIHWLDDNDKFADIVFDPIVSWRREQV